MKLQLGRMGLRRRQLLMSVAPRVRSHRRRRRDRPAVRWGYPWAGVLVRRRMPSSLGGGKGRILEDQVVVDDAFVSWPHKDTVIKVAIIENVAVF